LKGWGRTAAASQRFWLRTPVNSATADQIQHAGKRRIDGRRWRWRLHRLPGWRLPLSNAISIGKFAQAPFRARIATSHGPYGVFFV
jgi:hypothetical protein